MKWPLAGAAPALTSLFEVVILLLGSWIGWLWHTVTGIQASYIILE